MTQGERGVSHGDDGSNVVHTGYQHAQLCQGHGQEEGKGWLSPEPHGSKYFEDGDEVIVGNGLQDTWCTGGREGEREEKRGAQLITQ